MPISNSPAIELGAKQFYPLLPETYRTQHSIEDFATFLKQYLILSGDIVNEDLATAQGERHGFKNSTELIVNDEVYYFDEPTICPEKGYEYYIKLYLTSIMVLGSLDCVCINEDA
jgi:hypothetical protein